MIDDLLTDDAYLLHADLRRLMPPRRLCHLPGGQPAIPAAAADARAITADPATRTALFSVTEALDNLGTQLHAAAAPAPRTGRYGRRRCRAANDAVLEGPPDGSRACVRRSPWTAAPAGQRRRRRHGADLGSGHRRAAARCWKATPGWVNAVCAVTRGRPGAAGQRRDDGTVRIWDPATGQQHAVLRGPHGTAVSAVCAVTVDGRTLLASAGDRRHGADLGSGHRRSSTPSWRAHQGGVNGGVRGHRGGRTLLASAGDDGTVRIWDPATGAAACGPARATRAGSMRYARSPWTAAPAGQRRRRRDGADLGSGYRRSSARSWRHTRAAQCGVRLSPWTAGTCWPAAAATGRCGSGTRPPGSSTQPGRPYQRGQCGVRGYRGRPAPAGQRRRRRDGADLGSGHRQRSTRSWKATRAGSRRCARSPSAGRRCWPAPAATGRCGSGTRPPASQHAVLEGHQGAVNAVCAFTVDGRRCWPAAAATARCGSGTRPPAASSGPGGPHGPVNAVCAVTVDGRHAAGQRRRRRHGADLGPGHRRSSMRSWRATPPGQCGVRVHRGRPARCWPAAAATGRCGSGTRPPATSMRSWRATTGPVNAVCAFTVDGRTLLASGGGDGTVRVWDPSTGAERTVLEGHVGPVSTVCAFIQDGRTLLASGDYGRTIRIWDARKTTTWLIVPVHHPVRAVVYVPDVLVIAVNAGLLAINLDFAFSE